MKLIKLLAAVTGVLAGISLFIIQKQKKDEENAKLDEYLMQDVEPTTEPMAAKTDVTVMDEDIFGWKNLPAEYLPVTISFGFEQEAQAKSFQDQLAAAGYSSELDRENKIVDVAYNQDFSQPSLSALAEQLSAALEANQGQYQGFHFH